MKLSEPLPGKRGPALPATSPRIGASLAPCLSFPARKGAGGAFQQARSSEMSPEEPPCSVRPQPRTRSQE